MANDGPYGGNAWGIPGRIQAEDFDKGGEGVAYHDTTSENQGGKYRDTAVDIENTEDSSGQYNVGWIKDSEWLEYTVNVTDGTYDINVRVASDTSGGTLVILLDGNQIASKDISGTGGWQNWSTVTISGTSISGTSSSVLRLEFYTENNSAYNINWIEFVEQDSGSSSSSQTVVGEYVFKRINGNMQAVPISEGSGLSIITLPATNISSSSATLEGELKGTMKDRSVEVYFEYLKAGEDPPLFETSKQTMSSTGSFSADITDLGNVTSIQSNTEYEFWAVVETSNGEIMGKDKVFKTT